jgi:hypothetical protein
MRRMAHQHAVIYAVGARSGRRVTVPGEGLAGVHSAADLVGWYNGQADHRSQGIDLTGSRAVIIGNGDIALDIGRVPLSDPDSLAGTDSAEAGRRNRPAPDEVRGYRRNAHRRSMIHSPRSWDHARRRGRYVRVPPSEGLS